MFFIIYCHTYFCQYMSQKLRFNTALNTWFLKVLPSFRNEYGYPKEILKESWLDLIVLIIQNYSSTE